MHRPTPLLAFQQWGRSPDPAWNPFPSLPLPAVQHKAAAGMVAGSRSGVTPSQQAGARWEAPEVPSSHPQNHHLSPHHTGCSTAGTPSLQAGQGMPTWHVPSSIHWVLRCLPSSQGGRVAGKPANVHTHTNVVMPITCGRQA